MSATELHKDSDPQVDTLVQRLEKALYQSDGKITVAAAIGSLVIVGYKLLKDNFNDD